jgi:hypothetical protein
MQLSPIPTDSYHPQVKNVSIHILHNLENLEARVTSVSLFVKKKRMSNFNTNDIF